MNDNEKRNLILHYLNNKPRGEYNIESLLNGITKEESYHLCYPLREKDYVHYRTTHEGIHKGTTFIEITESGRQFIINGGYNSKVNNFWTKNEYQNLKIAGTVLGFLVATSLTIIINWKVIKETLGF